MAQDSHGLAGFVSLKHKARISQFSLEPRREGQGVEGRLRDKAQRTAGNGDEPELTVNSSGVRRRFISALASLTRGHQTRRRRGVRSDALRR